MLSNTLKAASTLGAASIISPVIAIVLTPVLMSYYDKNDFGQLALFLSVTTILAMVATGRAELKIAKCKTQYGELKAKQSALKFGSSNLLFIGAPISIIVTYWLFENILLGWIVIGSAVALMFINVSTLYLLSRHNINKLAVAKSAQPLSEVGTQLVAGALNHGGKFNLLVCMLVGQLVALRVLGYRLFRLGKLISLNFLKIYYKRNKNNITYTTGAYLVNALALHGMPMFFVAFYSDLFVGEYSVLQRTLGGVFYLTSSLFSQIFVMNFSSVNKKNRKLLKYHYVKTLSINTIVSLFFCFLGFICWPYIASYLPSNWTINQDLLYLAMLLFAVQLIAVPVSSFLNLTDNHKLQFYWEVTRIICVTCVLASCFILSYPVLEAFKGYAYTMVVFYALLIILHIKVVFGILGEKNV